MPVIWNYVCISFLNEHQNQRLSLITPRSRNLHFGLCLIERSFIKTMQSLSFRKTAFDIPIQHTTLGIIFSKRQWILPYFFLNYCWLYVLQNTFYTSSRTEVIEMESRVQNKGLRGQMLEFLGVKPHHFVKRCVYS